MSTISVCGSDWSPAARSRWSACRAWPVFVSCMSSCLVPTICPTTRAAATNASQPKTAVFQWLALQRPIRAARLFDCFKGDMASFRSGFTDTPRLAARPPRADVAGWCLGVRLSEPQDGCLSLRVAVALLELLACLLAGLGVAESGLADLDQEVERGEEDDPAGPEGAACMPGERPDQHADSDDDGRVSRFARG